VISLRQCTFTPNRVDVFGTGITLPGHADVSQAAAGPCRLQLYAVLGSSGVKLPEYTCTVLRAVRAVRIENRSIISVARDFRIPFRSLTRYCSRASEDDKRRISQNSTFSIGYKKARQLSSGLFLLHGISDQRKKNLKCSVILFIINGSLHKMKCSHAFYRISHSF
jgi:hypothetical protein